MKSKKQLLIFSVALIILIFMAAGAGAQAGVFDSISRFLTQSFVGVPTSTKPVATSSVTLYKPVLDYETAVIDAVERATPSVVSIVISKDVPLIENCPYDPFGNLPPEFRGMFGDGFQFSQPCEKGTEKQDVGGGSGFIVSEDGLIFTNKHVVVDTKAEYTVFTSDGKKYDATVLDRDPVNDIALLKIKATGLKPATLGNSDTIKLGQTAIAIGNALGEYRNTVSVGVISGLSRDVTATGNGIGAENIQGVIQTDTAINPGNSGGPLLNLKGEVIGVNTAIVSGAQSIGFSIPINQAKRAIDSVKKTGSIKTAYLGVRYTLVNADMAKKQKLPVNEGALIRGNNDGPGVIPGSPADKAGILAEDIITAINGEKVEGGKALAWLIQKYGVGETIRVSIQRGEKTLELSAILSERPKDQ